MEKISKEQVERIARLAKLNISPAQAQHIQKDMESILAFADQLAVLDVTDVPPTTHAVRIQNVFREDASKHSAAREQLLAQAPVQDGACYVVPKVVD